MPEDKSLEDLKKEREEAAKQLEQIISMSRPKGLVSGVGSGVNNIVRGAIGGVGVAVLMPTVGLGFGLRSGGLIGGAIGVAGGAVAGALGGVAVVVGGAVGGVSQIVRGILMTPESILAPRQGKWWNEYEGKWVKTSLPEEEASVLKGVPEDDKDILGSIEAEIDASMELGPDDEKDDVKEMYYYDALELPANAEPSAIKRKYYTIARKYHPDKNDSEEAAEKFKVAAEAYQVLSDPELRKKYDKEGRDGLSADKTDVAGGAAPKLDPAVLFAFLFGSDQFSDYIGRLSTATSASIGDSPKVSVSDARKIHKRRVTRLALKLAAKIDPYVVIAKESGDLSAVQDEWKAEVKELSEASYGHQLVTTIGKIYNLLAVMYEGSVDSGQGLPSLSKWAANQDASIEKKEDATQNKMEALKAGMSMMQIQAELKQKMEKAQTDEERQAIAEEMETKASEVLLRILWTTVVVDITSTVHETTQMVFFDQSVDKETRAHRAAAVKSLGQIWMDCPAPKSSSDEEKDAKRLYEEAAFAAMLETVKRRDEAAYAATS